jgi:hypothetical protein
LISPRQSKQATANLRTPANQLCFLLSCGYFKASKRFFPARTFHPRDAEYVVGRTGLRLEQIELLAERQLRPAVIARKISCGNKTQKGARTWQWIAASFCLIVGFESGICSM